jgi:hypothetical protein
MKALVLAAATAIGIGLFGASGVSAAPANGIVIDKSVAALDQVAPQEVGWRWRHRHWGWRHHHWRWGSRHWRWGSRR